MNLPNARNSKKDCNGAVNRCRVSEILISLLVLDQFPCFFLVADGGDDRDDCEYDLGGFKGLFLRCLVK